MTREEILSSEAGLLVDALWEVLAEQQYGLGLCASQLHVNSQMFVAHFPQTEFAEDVDPLPKTSFFNPRLRLTSEDEIQQWEGNLSIPGIVGLVSRKSSCIIDYLDENAKPRAILATGILSGLLQHEWDMLQGIDFVDRMSDRAKRRYLLPMGQPGLLSSNPVVCSSGTWEFVDPLPELVSN
eukprot:CAMPEP_0177655480 /NCGR_PEP_ID=MMETSP0447-20121125/14994_1 /TAXON_ID=0 /ORGANISM="Stygamoeba regulata, Strain BSH-02190019" /LENGTH=181 /DNA_ID=CAMNT_0019159411 /DNA_START=199 /DNA_END=744 /DNA_ORIENTATION=+